MPARGKTYTPYKTLYACYDWNHHSEGFREINVPKPKSENRNRKKNKQTNKKGQTYRDFTLVIKKLIPITYKVENRFRFYRRDYKNPNGNQFQNFTFNSINYRINLDGERRMNSLFDSINWFCSWVRLVRKGLGRGFYVNLCKLNRTVTKFSEKYRQLIRRRINLIDTFKMVLWAGFEH